jgi:hypothetical protein
MPHLDGIIECEVIALDGGGQLGLGPAPHGFGYPGSDA